jgi:hypothetical protein
MTPWREISSEMRLLRIGVVVAFLGTAAATLADGYVENAAMSQPTTATLTYGYPIHVRGEVRYVTSRQDEIHRLAAPVMTWGISAVILLGGLHVLLENRMKEAARRKQMQDLLGRPPEK